MAPKVQRGRVTYEFGHNERLGQRRRQGHAAIHECCGRAGFHDRECPEALLSGKVDA